MGFGFVVRLVFLSGVFSHGCIYANQWFVSKLNGTSDMACGLEPSRPCKTIHQATSRAHDGDVINIDGAGTSRDPYRCEYDSVTDKDWDIAGVVMRSYKTRAFIACRSNSFRFSCDWRMNASNGVSLKGITFVNTSLFLIECPLKMADCNFVNGSVEAVSLSFRRNPTGHVDLNGCMFQNNSATSLNISGNTVNLSISNSSFSNNKLHNVNSTILTMSIWTRLTVNFTIVNVSLNSCPGKACFEIVAGVSGKLTLEMDQVNFENNEAGESILDVSGSSNVELKSTEFRTNTGRAVKLHDGNSLELKIAKGEFAGNEIEQKGNGFNGGAVDVSGFTQKAFVSLWRSNFSSNKAENGGACAFGDISVLILDIENCQFIQNEAWSSSGALAVGGNQSNRWLNNSTIDIRSSNSSGNILASGDPWSAVVGGGGALALNVFNMQSLSLTNSTFVGNKAEGRNSGAILAQFNSLYKDAVILNCEFIRNTGGLWSGTLQLSVINPQSSTPHAPVIIQHTKFLENNGNSSYDILLFQGHLIMKSCKMQRNSGGGVFIGSTSKTLDVLVENSLISDNINFAFHLYGDSTINNASAYQFNNVSFINNDCKARDSIFQVSMLSGGFFYLQASTFVDNFCKSGVMEIFVQPLFSGFSRDVVDTRVNINNAEFLGNSGVSESTLTILNVRKVNVENSNFTNNFGEHDGSHLSVQLRSSELTIYNTNFYQSQKSQAFNTSREQAYNGFLTVTSFGNISIRESSFVSDPFGAKDLIFVKGACNVVMNDSVQIKAPFSAKLLLHNFTYWELRPNVSRSLVTSFSLATEPCPIGTYSINRGSSKGLTIENHVNCIPCPTGGNCTSVLAARPNFWGYPLDDKVHFKLCPQGYCCPAVDQKCRYHNSSYMHSGCQGHRTGILCGRCKKNFSDTLFTTHCLLNKDCTHLWYLVIIFICTTSFALFLVRKPPVFELLMKNLTWFLPSDKRKDYEDTDSLDSVAKTNSTSSYGFLKITFYFYQIAGVLTISNYGVSWVLKENIVLPAISLLDFKISVNNNWSICPFPGITPLSKTLFQLAAVTAIFLSIPFIYLLHSGLNKLRKRTSALPPSGPYLGAILEIVLLGYSAATGTAMKLLNCGKIQHVSRWYYDADITCYQWWQNASIAAIALFLFPFILTLYFASLRLYRGQISAKMFLLACVFPLPYLLLVFVFHVYKVITRPRDCQEMTSTTLVDHEEEKDTCNTPSTIEQSVLEVLSAPFCKPNDDQSLGKIYWESVLIGRRFILIVIGSFVEYAFLRSVFLTILCLLFLLHHISQKPFAQFYANLAETVSLATLVVIAILNVGVTSYYSAGLEARGVQSEYVHIFLLAEAVLLCFVPVVFAAFVLLSLVSQLVRLTIMLIQAVQWLVYKSKTHNESLRLGQHQPLLTSAA